MAENGTSPSDINLTGGFFRMDLKTIVLLGGILLTWWDGRHQDQKERAVEQARAEYSREMLGEVKRLQMLQQIEINNIRLALAESGIRIKKGDM